MAKFTVELHRYHRFIDKITIKAKTVEEAVEIAQKVRGGLDLNYEDGDGDYFDRGLIVYSDDNKVLFEKDTENLDSDE